VGDGDGISEGDVVGKGLEGATVCVGFGDGNTVGKCVGIGVGTCVGVSVGSGVGSFVGW